MCQMPARPGGVGRPARPSLWLSAPHSCKGASHKPTGGALPWPCPKISLDPTANPRAEFFRRRHNGPSKLTEAGRVVQSKKSASLLFPVCRDNNKKLAAAGACASPPRPQAAQCPGKVSRPDSSSSLFLHLPYDEPFVSPQSYQTMVIDTVKPNDIPDLLAAFASRASLFCLGSWIKANEVQLQ